MPREGKHNRSGAAAILELDELKALLYEMSDPYRGVVEVCYLTAGRIGEVLQLRGEHVRGGYLMFPAPNTKTSTTRQVTLTKPLVATLSRLPQRGYLFPSHGKTGHLTARAVEKWVKRAADLLDYQGVSMHSFRRSRLTHLYEQGWPLNELMRVSGHKSLGGLQHYLGVEQGLVDAKLAAADENLSLQD